MPRNFRWQTENAREKRNTATRKQVTTFKGEDLPATLAINGVNLPREEAIRLAWDMGELSWKLLLNCQSARP